MSRTPSRFELLETDDYPSHPTPIERIEQETETARRHHAEELARVESMTRAKRAEAEAERERAEATERRHAAATAMTEKRRARAKSRHKGLGAKNRVNEKLYAIKYTPTVSDAVSEATSICEDEGFVVIGERHTGEEVRGSVRRVYSVEDEEGKEYGLTIVTYKMPSGTQYEITSYLS